MLQKMTANSKQTLHISLPVKMRRYIERQTKQQNFSTKSDFVQHIIREDMKKEKQMKLERMLLEGLASGGVSYNKKAWEKTKKEIKAKISTKK